MRKVLFSILVTFVLCFALCVVTINASAQTVASGTCGAQGDNLTWVLDDHGTLTISGTGAMLNSYYNYWIGLTNVPGWYYYSDNIENVVIMDGVTNIGECVFCDCVNLKSVVIASTVTSIGDQAFRYCLSLESITIPATVTKLGDSFAMLSGLKRIYFEGSMPEFSHYDGHCYDCGAWDCDGGCCGTFCQLNDTVIYYPAGDPSYNFVNTWKDMCHSSALSFVSYDADEEPLSWIVNEYGNATITGLKDKNTVELVIPEFIAGYKVTAIAPSAFSGCSALQKVTIPDGVTTIGAKAFSNCAELGTIIFDGTAAEIAADSFIGVTADVFYQSTGNTWTEVKRQNYGGQLTWIVILPETFEIDASRMILGNALEFQFGVSKDKISNTAGYYAVIEKSWADGTSTTKTIPAEAWGTAGTYWAIVYDGLAAKEMGDIFYVTIYNSDGYPVSKAKTDSVLNYVDRAYAAQDDKGKTMMVDMLNYGAAAQLNFGYSTESLANRNLTEDQKAMGTKELAALNDNQFKGPNCQGARLVLESHIQMQVAFSGLTENMYAIYSFTDNAGKVQSVRVEDSDFVKAGNMQGIELNRLVYADARAVVTVIVYNADGSIYGLATDSIESYVKRSTKGDDVFSALMKFADSAKAYLY